MCSATTADEAVAALKAWDTAHEEIQLGGIGVLWKDEVGNINKANVRPTLWRKGAGVGMILGLVAALPTGGLSLLPGIAGGALAGGVAGSQMRNGFHDLSQSDVERISRELTPGRAVVGVLAPREQADAVLEKLAQYGGKIESHEVSDDELQQAAQAAAAANQPG